VIVCVGTPAGQAADANAACVDADADAANTRATTTVATALTLPNFRTSPGPLAAAG
jgi:hypothetical protein